jgi:putative ABC transport system ATP-binding protein
MEPVLKTNQVTKIYNSGEIEIRAVDEVNLELHPGEFVALVGPSGSGKTTLLALMAALLEPTHGQVIIDGKDLGTMKESERGRFRREHIGFTFQANNLVPYLNVKENVELMLRLNGRRDADHRQKVLDLLRRLGLEEQSNKLPNELSGGQRQRVAIARALIHDPSLVLADEPTASLDTERANQVVQIFADLIHEQGKAGVMVTHDLRMAKYVDRVIQMVDGQISEVVTNRPEIEQIAGTDEFAIADAPIPVETWPRHSQEAVPMLQPAQSQFLLR